MILSCKPKTIETVEVPTIHVYPSSDHDPDTNPLRRRSSQHFEKGRVVTVCVVTPNKTNEIDEKSKTII